MTPTTEAGRAFGLHEKPMGWTRQEVIEVIVAIEQEAAAAARAEIVEQVRGLDVYGHGSDEPDPPCVSALSFRDDVLAIIEGKDAK